MAKDDYFVIVYKILSYLYVKLKSGEDTNPNMITHDSQLLQINRKYWDYIMRNLIEDGYITCETEKVWGKELIYDLKTAEITPILCRFSPSLANSLFLINKPPPGTKYVPETE